MPLRRLSLLLAVVVLVSSAACGGGKSRRDTKAQVQDQVHAAQITHASLLNAQDLEGNWAVFISDNFRNDDSTLPDNDACRGARTLAMDMAKANVDRAQRALQLTLPNQTSRAQIEMQVRLYDGNATAAGFLKRQRDVLTGDHYLRCLSDGFVALFGAGAQVRGADTRARPPSGGIAAGFDQYIPAQEGTVALHSDYFAWVQDNLYVLVVISGPRGLDSKDFSNQALDKMQKQVDAALKLPK